MHRSVSKLDITEEDSQVVRSFKVKVAAATKRRWDLDSLDIIQVPVLATAPLQSRHQLLSIKDCFYVPLGEEDKTNGNGTNNEEQISQNFMRNQPLQTVII